MLAGVVLAAGFGTRLRPLTHLRPKALCPVANVPLVDLAIERVAAHVTSTAVNVHHHRDQMSAHLRGRVHLSTEEPEPLGTGGAIAALAEWIDGRDVLITNSDSWQPDGVAALVDGWDGERIRLLVTRDVERGDFGPWRFAGTSLLPARFVGRLPREPAGLYEVLWRDEHAAGRVDFCVLTGPFVACDTPVDYLDANLGASRGESVIGDGAVVLGEVRRSVVWPGAVVRSGERLHEVIRAGDAQNPVTVSAGR